MGANRIIAISGNGDTKYLVSATNKWDREKEELTFLLETGASITDAEIFTKKQAIHKIEILKSKGFFALAINPYEEGRYYRVSIKIKEPNWITDHSFGLSINYRSEVVRFPDRTTYTNKNKIIKFDKLNEYLTSFDFRTKDDAKLFIDNNKEHVFELFKESFSLKTYYN